VLTLRWLPAHLSHERRKVEGQAGIKSALDSTAGAGQA